MVKIKKYTNTISIFLFLFSVSAFSQKTAEEYFDDAVRKYTLSDLTGSIKDLNKAIELKPDHFEAYYMRGLTKICLDLNDGCLDLRKAVELGYIEANYAIEKYCDQNYGNAIQEALP